MAISGSYYYLVLYKTTGSKILATDLNGRITKWLWKKGNATNSHPGFVRQITTKIIQKWNHFSSRSLSYGLVFNTTKIYIFLFFKATDASQSRYYRIKWKSANQIGSNENLCNATFVIFIFFPLDIALCTTHCMCHRKYWCYSACSLKCVDSKKKNLW